MVSNSAQLDSRTKQHTQFGVSASNGSRDMALIKVAGKKRKKKKRKEKKIKKNEHLQNYIASPTGIANNNNNDSNNKNLNNNNNNNETGSRSPCMRSRSDPPNFGPMERCEKQTNNID